MRLTGHATPRCCTGPGPLLATPEECLQPARRAGHWRYEEREGPVKSGAIPHAANPRLMELPAACYVMRRGTLALLLDATAPAL